MNPSGLKRRKKKEEQELKDPKPRLVKRVGTKREGSDAVVINLDESSAQSSGR